MVIVGLLLICAGLLLHSRLSLKKLKQSAYMDPVTGGLTEAGFQIKGQKLLAGKSRTFALISMQTNDLMQICKTFGVKVGLLEK